MSTRMLRGLACLLSMFPLFAQDADAAYAAQDTPTPPASQAEQASAQAGPRTNGLRGSVALTLAEPSPIIGVTSETLLRIEVTDPPEDPMPMPRLLCSVGRIEDLEREGPTHFRARYIPPASRFPQPAIIVAEFATTTRRVRGMLAVRLRAATTYTLRTNPGALVTLRVEDREFGPHVAPANGAVHIPVVVPPGVELATARSVNQHGKATEQTVALRVPYSQRLLFAAPETLSAGAIDEVAVYAVEPSGVPANASALVLRAQGNKVYPLGGQTPGEARFLVSAPMVLKERTLRIEAQIKGQNTTRIATRIALLPGKAARLTLEPESARLSRKPDASMRVFVGAADAFGNPVDASRAAVLVDGKSEQVSAGPDGEPTVVVKAPARHGPHDAVLVEGLLDQAYASRPIPIGGRVAKPAKTLPARLAAPDYTVTPRLGVMWNLGDSAGASLFLDATAFRSAQVPDLGVGMSVGIVQSWFEAESAGGITRTSLSTVPALFHVERRFRLGPTFFAVGAGAGFAMAFARIETFGTRVFAHAFGAALDGNVQSGFVLRNGHLVFSLHYLAVYLSDFNTGDRIVGNAAGAIVDAGYRFVW